MRQGYSGDRGMVGGEQFQGQDGREREEGLGPSNSSTQNQIDPLRVLQPYQDMGKSFFCSTVVQQQLQQRPECSTGMLACLLHHFLGLSCLEMWLFCIMDFSSCTEQKEK